MHKGKSIWNGYKVHGDVKTLDLIAEETGMVNLDKDDIISVLSDGGENYVTTGVSDNISNAFSEAVDNLPCKIDKVNKMLAAFRCGVKQPTGDELTAISAILSEASPDLEFAWGLTSDESLGDSYKVVLVASVKED